MTQGAIKLLAIQIGGAICLPVLMVGQLLEQKVGLGGALFSIFWGNLFLFGLGLIASELSLSEKKTTAEHAEKYFGKLGMKGFSLALLISMGGWFAIQLKALTDLFPLSPLFLGGLITLSTLKGIKALELISLITSPLLAIFLVCPLFKLEGDVPLLDLNYNGVSLVMAAASLAVLDLPTFFRFAKSKNSARVASFFLFVILLPLVEGIGAILSAYHPKQDLIQMLGGGLSVSLFILIAGWTTNNMNLYSAAINLKNLVPSLKESHSILIVGVISSLLAYVNPFEYLDFIALLASAMGGVMLISFILNNQKAYTNIASTILAGASCLFLPATGLILLDAYGYAFGFSLLGGLYAAKTK